MHKYKLTLLVFALIFASCTKKEPVQVEQKPPKVSVTNPKIKTVTHQIEKIATLKPCQRSEIHAKIAGSISDIYVKDGVFVEKNMPLFSIDTREQSAIVKEKKSSYELAVVEILALKKKLQRIESLVEKELIAQSELDQLKCDLEIKKKECEKQAALLEKERIKLELHTQKAPFAGNISNVSKSPSEEVLIDTVICTVTNIDHLFAECFLTEKELDLIQKDAQIDCLSLVHSDKKAIGKITFIDSTFDNKNARVLVRVDIDNTLKQFLGGHKAKLKLPTKTIPEALTLEKGCITYNQNQPFVYTISDDSKAELTPVEVEESSGSLVIIRSGLKPDSVVVKEGRKRLYPGCVVEVKKT